MRERRTSRAPRTTAKVSARMRSVRVRDTAPELAVRKLLHALGVRFRVRPTKLPGRPDITNCSKRWCIFVHGCFWHGHECWRGRPPRKNVSFWTQKIATNRERDARTHEALQAQGYRVLTVWQCELDDVARLRLELAGFARTERVEPAA